MKGVQIEYFTLCIAFRKVISFIYQKNNSSDRVPLRDYFVPLPSGGRDTLIVMISQYFSGYYWSKEEGGKFNLKDVQCNSFCSLFSSHPYAI